MKLSIVIVNYNVKFFVEQCLDSVKQAMNGLDCEVFVVDNHSSDNSIDYLKPRFPWVKFIDCNHNLGFARANNIAIRQSAGEYVLLLNPDTFIAENVLHEALLFMDKHPKAGGVGVRMHNSDGSLAMESRRALPTPMVSFLKMLGRSGKYYMSHLPWDKPAKIDIISGAFCLMRRKVIEQIGMLDEDFFMYGEDIDLSYRILKCGFENWFLPLDILHYKGESTQKSSFRYVHVFYQAMIIFFRKHYGHLSMLITAPIKLAIYFRAFMAYMATMYWNVRRSLGFVDVTGNREVYLFKGNEKMIEECRQLAQRKGIDEAVQGKMPTCVVYDTCTWTYQQIINDRYQDIKPGLRIGTYSKTTHTIITQSEIIR